MTTALNPAWTAGITGGKGASAGTSYIAGLGGTGFGYFKDQNGNPKLFVPGSPKGLLATPGRGTGPAGSARGSRTSTGT